MAAEKINGRVAFADLLRVFGIIAVIVLSLTGSTMEHTAVSTQSWWILNLYDGLSRWCVPVFVMLSGMFMLDPKGSSSLSRLFLHNMLRLFLCLLFWGGIYAVVGYAAAGGRFTWHGLWDAILSALRGNTHYHLWFLYIILGLYLVTPILRAFVRGASRKELHYFFVLCFLFASLLPTLFHFWPRSTAPLQVWYDRLEVRMVLGYVGYYVAGYYLKEYTISRLAEAIAYVLGIVGAVVTVWGTAALSRSAGRFTDPLYGWFSPNVVWFSVAIVVLFRYVLGISEERSRRQRLSGTARLVFGMYLVHVFFLMLLDFLGIGVLSFNPVASVPLLTAAVFLCSFALSWLLAHIPFLGNWLT